MNVHNYLTSTTELGILAIFSFLWGILFIYNYPSPESGKIFPPCLGDRISGKPHSYSKIMRPSPVAMFYFLAWFMFSHSAQLELDLDAYSEEDRHGWDGTHQLRHLIPYISCPSDVRPGPCDLFCPMTCDCHTCAGSTPKSPNTVLTFKRLRKLCPSCRTRQWIRSPTTLAPSDCAGHGPLPIHTGRDA